MTLEDSSGSSVYAVDGIDPWVFSSIRQSLFEVVNGKLGTGKLAQLPEAYPFKVAGKTGTAQLRKINKELQKDRDLHVAWFAGFAPFEDPEVAVVVLVEGALSGGKEAAPLASQVLETYFNRNEPDKEEVKEEKEDGDDR